MTGLDAVELLFTSLLVQANTAMLRAGAKRDAYGRSRTRAFRQSFLIAYAIRIGERLSHRVDDDRVPAVQVEDADLQRRAVLGRADEHGQVVVHVDLAYGSCARSS